MKKKFALDYALVIFFIIAFDRLTKSLALGLTEEKIINNFLSFGLTFNRGINWGLFNSSSSAQFWIINGLIATVIAAMVMYTGYCYRLRISIMPNILILAGAVSNYYDRIMHGGVIDFIVLSAGNWSWPAFNIADAAILMGIALIILNNYKNS